MIYNTKLNDITWLKNTSVLIYFPFDGFLTRYLRGNFSTESINFNIYYLPFYKADLEIGDIFENLVRRRIRRKKIKSLGSIEKNWFFQHFHGKSRISFYILNQSFFDWSINSLKLNCEFKTMKIFRISENFPENWKLENIFRNFWRRN